MVAIRIVKPSTESEKATQTTMDTIELTPKLVSSWKSPPFQRDLKVNAKVVALSAELAKGGGVVPGIVTVGVLDGETYIVDGQHRLAAWLTSGCEVGYADVRTHWFKTVGDMAAEFVRLNSQLVKMRPDDILRGMESSNKALQRIRRRCGYIGYDMVRRSEKAPVLSMSVFLRSWIAGKPEVPQAGSSIAALAMMDETETTNAIEFVSLCFEAWRRDEEYARLWSTLNLTLCGWLYRRLVLGEVITGRSRSARFTVEDFRRCVTALSAEGPYLEYLVGRTFGERDRGPCYGRIKNVFQRRYLAETGRAVKLPGPAWAHGRP